MMKKGFLLLAAACAISSAASAKTTDNAFAQDKATLRLDGLDLSTAKGQEDLAIRMDQAARAVCGDRLATIHLALAERARACQVAVKADIRAQIESQVANAKPAMPTQLAANN
jgi:UrcA family protein